MIRRRKGWILKRRFTAEHAIGMITEDEAGVKARSLASDAAHKITLQKGQPQ